MRLTVQIDTNDDQTIVIAGSPWLFGGIAARGESRGVDTTVTSDVFVALVFTARCCFTDFLLSLAQAMRSVIVPHLLPR
jgi:hypothetical protein